MVLCLALAGIAVAPAALAQGSPVPGGFAAAEALYQDAKRLMSEGNYAEACPKLEESQRLDPGGGTLLNLAVCHEKVGKIATAWAEFNEALASARRDGRAERQKLAEERIAALTPRLPRLTITVPPASSVEGLAIKLGGVVMGRASYGTAMPVDPGTIPVTADAPGRKALETSVEIKEGESLTFEVPPLEVAPVSAPPAAPPPIVAPPLRTTPVPMPVPDRAESGGGMRIAGFVIGGVGVAALGVGAVFGAKAISSWSESNDHCPADRCDQAGADLSAEAQQSATIANIGVGVGAVGVLVGTTLILVGGSRGSEAPKKQAIQAPGRSIGVSVSAAPFFDAQGGGLSLRGTW